MGSWTFPNDIAILVFATPVTIGGNTQPATLPVDDSNSYAGYTCVITGWGSTGTVRTPVKNALPVGYIIIDLAIPTCIAIND